jgi:hypothetical protein
MTKLDQYHQCVSLKGRSIAERKAISSSPRLRNMYRTSGLEIPLRREEHTMSDIIINFYPAPPLCALEITSTAEPCMHVTPCLLC